MAGRIERLNRAVGSSGRIESASPVERPYELVAMCAPFAAGGSQPCAAR